MHAEGALENILRTSWEPPELTSQERPLNIRSGRPQDVRFGRPRDVRSGRPQDGQIRPLRDALGTLEGNVLGMSWGPILAGWDITHAKDAYRGFIDIRNRSLAFKNNAPFTNCISKINNILIGTAEDLDVVMSMYNLIKYSKSYRKTTGSLFSC